MYSIVIKENGKYTKQLSSDGLLTVGMRLRLKQKDSDAPPEVFEVTMEARPPAGLSGVFHQQVGFTKTSKPATVIPDKVYEVEEYT